jgi:hypothetical protein
VADVAVCAQRVKKGSPILSAHRANLGQFPYAAF